MDSNSRKRMNRMMIFFSIMSVALVWTWSQVGQRQLGQGTIEGENIVLLHTEADCNLAVGPCAAYLKDFALVASVVSEGEGPVWRIKLVGKGAAQLPVVSMLLLEPGLPSKQLRVVQQADEWHAGSSGKVLSGSLLRVYVRGGEVPLVADFPIESQR